MSYLKKRQARFAAAAIGTFVLAIIASRQLYLFVVFRSQPGLLDSQGGRLHLWLAGGATLLACIAGGLMFLFLMGRGKSERSELPVSPLAPPPALTKVKPNSDALMGDRFSAVRWAQQNAWCVEGQADDRSPMNGSVGASLGSASAQRSDARLAHQLMYRKWAGERRD